MIYLDNNATTKLDSEVLQSMLPYMTEMYGNASSIQHKMGREANAAIETSRNAIANYLGCTSKEIIFTSGSTESINFVIKGIYDRYKRVGNHIITSKTEHKAVLSTCAYLEKKGAKVTYLNVDTNGQINLEELKNSICEETILVTLMSANNETGIELPISEIARLCKEKDVLFFCDATQSIGKSTSHLQLDEIDILCFSSHKIYGPQGVGALYIKRKPTPIQLEPLIIGGSQENKWRAGTYNTAAVAGFGKAICLLESIKSAEIELLRDYFENSILQKIEDCDIHGKDKARIVNTSNIHFKYVKSDELLSKLYNVAASAGSACVSGDRSPSHVIKAMTNNDDIALCSVRFSLSKYTTRSEIDEAITNIISAVNEIREQSPIWQLYKDGLIE